MNKIIIGLVLTLLNIAPCYAIVYPIYVPSSSSQQDNSVEESMYKEYSYCRQSDSETNCRKTTRVYNYVADQVEKDEVLLEAVTDYKTNLDNGFTEKDSFESIKKHYDKDTVSRLRGQLYNYCISEGEKSNNLFLSMYTMADRCGSAFEVAETSELRDNQEPYLSANELGRLSIVVIFCGLVVFISVLILSFFGIL